MEVCSTAVQNNLISTVLSADEVSVDVKDNASSDKARPKRTSKTPLKFQDHILDKSQKDSELSVVAEQVEESISDPGILYCTCKQPWNDKDGDSMIF